MLLLLQTILLYIACIGTFATENCAKISIDAIDKVHNTKRLVCRLTPGCGFYDAAVFTPRQVDIYEERYGIKKLLGSCSGESDTLMSTRIKSIGEDVTADCQWYYKLSLSLVVRNRKDRDVRYSCIIKGQVRYRYKYFETAYIDNSGRDDTTKERRYEENIYSPTAKISEHVTGKVNTTTDSMYQKEKPVYTVRDKEYSTEKHIYTSRVPSYNTEKPFHTTRGVVYLTEKPAYPTRGSATEKQVNTTRSPNYSTERQIYLTRSLVYSTEKPVYTARSPVYSTEKPSYITRGPVSPAETKGSCVKLRSHESEKDANTRRIVCELNPVCRGYGTTVFTPSQVEIFEERHGKKELLLGSCSNGSSPVLSTRVKELVNDETANCRFNSKLSFGLILLHANDYGVVYRCVIKGREGYRLKSFENVYRVTHDFKGTTKTVKYEPVKNVYTTRVKDYKTEIQGYTTRGPKFITETPVYTKRSPQYTMVRPVYTTKGPVYSTEKPVYTTRGPIYHTETPVYTTRSPQYTMERPVYTTNGPVYSTEKPVYTTRGPMYPSEKQVYTTRGTVYSTEKQVYITRDKVESTEEPLYTKRGLGYLSIRRFPPTREPLYSTNTIKEPGYLTKSPLLTSKSIEYSTEKPLYSIQDPRNRTEKPVNTTKATYYSSAIPIYTTSAPENSTGKPTYTTNLSKYPTEKPLYTTRGPVYVTVKQEISDGKDNTEKQDNNACTPVSITNKQTSETTILECYVNNCGVLARGKLVSLQMIKSNGITQTPIAKIEKTQGYPLPLEIKDIVTRFKITGRLTDNEGGYLRSEWDISESNDPGTYLCTLSYVNVQGEIKNVTDSKKILSKYEYFKILIPVIDDNSSQTSQKP